MKLEFIKILVGIIILHVLASTSCADGGPRYDIGTPVLIDIWVNPVSGNDANTGVVRTQALRTITEAWGRIPFHTTLTQGYRILLVQGTYPEESIPLYWDGRYGTFLHPILIQAADGRGTATLTGSVNIHDTRFLYFDGVNIRSNGDTFHCERCDTILLRKMVLSSSNRSTQEVVKINQSSHIYLEDSDVSSAWNVCVDFVAVQHSSIVGNKIHDAGDWCAYVKGGSSYIHVEGNDFYNCDVGGFTAGQGSGFEYMQTPWLHYEAYDVKIVNNIVRETNIAGLGVNGGYNVLMAYNTLYRVGQNDHIFEFNHGARSCDGDTLQCGANRAAGGWGTTSGGDQYIPNKNIFVFNNVVMNPNGYSSPWILQVAGPRTPPAGSGLTGQTQADANLVIKGNIIWNGSNDLGLGSDTGCSSSNVTCNETQLRRDNAINTIRPDLRNPDQGDYRPGNIIAGATTFTIPDFTWNDAPTRPGVPVGILSNMVPRDFNGAVRVSRIAGAFIMNSVIPNVPGAVIAPILFLLL